MTAHVCCILEVNTPRAAIHNAEVKPTCGIQTTYCYILVTVECVEVLKSYSMFCLHMTTGRWLTVSTISLPPLSFCLSGCISIYLYIFLNLENSLSDKVWFGLKGRQKNGGRYEIETKITKMIPGENSSKTFQQTHCHCIDWTDLTVRRYCDDGVIFTHLSTERQCY